MKIGFDAKRAFSNHSGLGNYSRSIITLMSSNYPENQYYLFTTDANRDVFTPGAGQLVVTPTNKLGKSFPSVWRTLRLKAELKRSKLDIYHGLSNELPLGISRSGIRTVVTIHDLIFLRFPGLYPFFDRQTYKAKFRYACRNADLVIAVSESTRNDIINFFKLNPDKVKVVYQSCNPGFLVKSGKSAKEALRKKYNLPDEFILSVGTLEERKNALSIVKAVHQQVINTPVVLAGKATSYLDKIKEYITQNRLEKQVILIHIMETADLPTLYQSATVFVYPSLFEGFGIPILEALSSGTPVITSNGGCFAETGGNAAKYVDPLDSEELGHQLIQVLNDQELRKQMIANGYEHASQFTGEKVATRLMTLYRGLLHQL